MPQLHRLALVAAVLLLPRLAAAQIGAEAQGGKLTTWLAVGFDKELTEHWASVTDVGYGRHSDPDDLRLLKRQGLFVLTQDFVYRFSPHWRAALSAGYWRRDAYNEEAPYNHRTPNAYRNELRPFQRLSYEAAAGPVLLSNTVRTDYRFYFTSGFRARWSTPFEFRARDLLAARLPLTHSQRHWLILNDELLTAADHYGPAAEAQLHRRWTPYQLTENRLSLYYRRSLPEHKLDCDLGLMYQRWREVQAPAFTTSYNLMLDFIVH